MEKRSGFLTFILALIPGLGYMYLGLTKRGMQILVLFLLIKNFLPAIGVGFLNQIILLPFWLYTFFDTFNVASKINRGEEVKDSEFIFEKYNWTNNNADIVPINTRYFIMLAWILIVVGVLAILTQTFKDSEHYQLLISYMSSYVYPILLISGGIYILVRKKSISKE